MLEQETIRYDVVDSNGSVVTSGDNRQKPIADAIKLAQPNESFRVNRITTIQETIGWVV